MRNIIKRMVLAFLLLMFASQTYAEVYVVCAGVTKYRNPEFNLMFPAADATTIAQFYNTFSNNVTLLRDQNASHDNILKALRTQFSKAKPDDMVVFFFSGHGGKGFLCPYDCTSSSGYLLYTEVFDIFRRCNALRKMIIVDACLSGGMRIERQTVNPNTNRPSSVVMFLSSRSNETSHDGNPDLGFKNGVFTTYLDVGLRGAADTNGDKYVTAKELFTYVSRKVAANSKNKQHPVMWGNFDDNFIMSNLRKLSNR